MVMKQGVSLHVSTTIELRVHMYVYVCTVDYINTQLTSLQPHTPFHWDMTLPHSTAGSEVPLQLAEVLGEAPN